MPDSFEFVVRPLGEATVAVGEEVSFREVGGKLYALNEDGEPFGVVHKAVAARLEEAGIDSLEAEVVGRAGDTPIISVPGSGGEGAAAGAAGGGGQVVAAEPQQPGPAEPKSAGAEPQTAEQVPSESAETGSYPVDVPGQPLPAGAESMHGNEAVPQSPDAMEPATGFNRESEPGQPAPYPVQATAAADDVSAGQISKKPTSRYVLIGIIVVLAVLLMICAVVLFSGSGSSGMQTVSDDVISLEVPADWEVGENDGSYVINSTDHDAVVTFTTVSDVLDGSLTADELCSEVIAGTNSAEDSEVDENSMDETVTDDGVIIRAYDYEYAYDGEDYYGSVELILSGSSVSVLGEICSVDALDDYDDLLDEVLDSVTVLDPAEPNLLDAAEAGEDDGDEVVEDEDEDNSAESASSSSSELLEPEIVESGYYLTDSGYVQYAVCWENPNEGYAIEYPELTITGKDADGAITFADTQTMSELLPGEIQYFGGFAGGGEGTVSVEFGVSQVDDYKFVATDEVAEEYYTISNTSVVEGSFDISFTGEITTNVELEDISMARLSVILRDEEGSIIYGDYGFVDLATEGGTVAFEISEYDLPDYATYEIYAIPWL